MSQHIIQPALERALLRAGGTHLWRDVVGMLMDGRAQYWAHGDGAVVTEIITTPRRKVVNYWLVGGRLADCLVLQEQIDPWAVREGCTHAIAQGRFGWARVLPRYGWRSYALAFAKELPR